MSKGRALALFNLFLGMALVIATPASAQVEATRERAGISIIFFDVSDLPARIDQPQLQKTAAGYVLNCAVANRSSEPLGGLRLIMLEANSTGKIRVRATWAEAAEIPPYSIKTFEFHPLLKEISSATGQFFLSIDEVMGHDTIWRTVDAEKLLRAYARGQHDLIPRVQTIANKFDSPYRPIIVPLERHQ